MLQLLHIEWQSLEPGGALYFDPRTLSTLQVSESSVSCRAYQVIILVGDQGSNHVGVKIVPLCTLDLACRGSLKPREAIRVFAVE